MLPALRLAAQRGHSNRRCVEEIVKQLKLTPEETEQVMPSGKQTTISNRVQWAVSYMAHAGLVERPRRAVFLATERGREVLHRNLTRIDNLVLSEFDSFREFRKRSARRDTADEEVAINDSATPEEKIEQSVLLMNTALREDLISRIMNAAPPFSSIGSLT